MGYNYRVRLTIDVEIDNDSHIDAAFQAASDLSEIDDLSMLVYDTAPINEQGEVGTYSAVDLQVIQELSDADEVPAPEPQPVTGRELNARERATAYARLTPDVCYRVSQRGHWSKPDDETVQFAVSPDGLGVYWYDSLMEVGENHGPIPIMRVSKKHFEELRVIADNGG